MPRATLNPAAKVLDFLKGVELPIAELVLSLAVAALKERQQRSREAKARATKPVARAAARTRAVFKPAPSTPKPTRPPYHMLAGTKKAAKPARRKSDKLAGPAPTPA